MTNPKPNTPADELTTSERFDYKRLKQLEIRGLDDYRELKKAPVLTPERVVAFINQLSPWNLKTTGLSTLEAYCNERVREAQLEILRGFRRRDFVRDDFYEGLS